MQTEIIQPETRSSLIINILEVAYYIDRLLAPILQLPPEGLYFPGRVEPVVLANQACWYDVAELIQHTQPAQYRHHRQLVTSLANIPQSHWDIVDREDGSGRVVVPHHLCGQTTTYPQLPYHGVKIVLEVIDNDIRSSRAFLNERRLCLEEVLLSRTHPNYANLIHLKTEEQIQSLISSTHEALLQVLRPVRDFLRGNPYQMCELHAEHLECVRIDQMGDYRIQDWHRRMGNGMWK